MTAALIIAAWVLGTLAIAAAFLAVIAWRRRRRAQRGLRHVDLGPELGPAFRWVPPGRQRR